MEEEKNSLIKEYALVKVGKDNLLELYNSFNGTEKDFRQYLDNNKKGFKNGSIEYYGIRENDSYIAQVTIMYNNTLIKESAIKNKRIYFNKLSTIKSKSNIGFEKLLIDLVIEKLKEKKKDKVSIYEYTISIGSRERKIRNILEDLGFKEYLEYINPINFRKELLLLRKDN